MSKNLHVVVCGECMDAAMSTWLEQYAEQVIPEGSYVQICLEGTDRDGNEKREFPWIWATEDSSPNQPVIGIISNTINIVDRSIILNHVFPGGNFIDAAKEMQSRISTIHTH